MKAQTKITRAVAQKILPIPTNGETMPPRKKGVKPSNAEALPAY